MTARTAVLHGESPEPKRRRGRPKGRAATLTSDAAARVMASGITPIDVMHDNMMFFFRRGLQLSDQLSDMIFMAREQFLRNEEGASAELEKMIRLFEKVTQARSSAQECARDLAPYCHSRLATLTVKPAGKPDEGFDFAATGDQLEAAAAYKRLIDAS